MKFNVVNTIQGLVPCDDNDFDVKKRLKIGETYEVSVVRFRNYQFHKKYFAMINCAWEYLDERQTRFFRSKEVFRKTMEVSAGHCEKIYSVRMKSWIDIPKSIAFNKMSATEFEDLYNEVRAQIFSLALDHISEEEFTNALIHF